MPPHWWLTLLTRAFDLAPAVHMLPPNFRRACMVLPELQLSLALLPGCRTSYRTTASANACACGTDAAAAAIVAEPRFAFLVGAWWFAEGSEVALQHLGCRDLRLDCDGGLGTTSSPSGYMKISRCVELPRKSKPAHY